MFLLKTIERLDTLLWFLVVSHWSLAISRSWFTSLVIARRYDEATLPLHWDFSLLTLSFVRNDEAAIARRYDEAIYFFS